jgi:vanillate O-demethylase ferredoxin subunit
MTTTALTLTVASAEMLTPLVRQLRLRAANGAALPGWQAGAHIQLQVTLPGGGNDWRHYSLIDPMCDLAADTSATETPHEYVIAVRREDTGRGGSRWVHDLAAGATLTVRPPKNDFPLGDHAATAVLVAGGIGVTPLASMAAQRLRQRLPVRLHYAGRSRDHMALLPALQTLLGEALALHLDDEAGAPLNVEALLARCAPDDVLYVCGPQVMLDAVLQRSEALGWPRERVHFELFAAPVADTGVQPYEVVLAQSGRQFTVAAGQTLLSALIAAGCDPMFDCQRGECGVCAVPVLEGLIDHRDFVLTQREKDAGNVIQTCVSRCKGQRLVLDL